MFGEILVITGAVVSALGILGLFATLIGKL
jgi:hypothetical protein